MLSCWLSFQGIWRAIRFAAISDGVKTNVYIIYKIYVLKQQYVYITNMVCTVTSGNSETSHEKKN